VLRRMVVVKGGCGVLHTQRRRREEEEG